MPNANQDEASGFVCDRCSKCCHFHRVPLTHVDLLRLEEAQPGTLERTVEFLPPEQLDWIGEPETVITLREGRRVLVLAHQTDGGCVFLESACCTIHSSRPSACRTYPFDRPASQEATLGLVPHLLCPLPTGFQITQNGVGANSQQATFSDLVKERDRELGDYALLVGRFNRRQRLRLGLRRPAEGRTEFLRDLLRYRRAS